MKTEFHRKLSKPNLAGFQIIIEVYPANEIDPEHRDVFHHPMVSPIHFEGIEEPVIGVRIYKRVNVLPSLIIEGGDHKPISRKDAADYLRVIKGSW